MMERGEQHLSRLRKFFNQPSRLGFLIRFSPRFTTLNALYLSIRRIQLVASTGSINLQPTNICSENFSSGKRRPYDSPRRLGWYVVLTYERGRNSWSFFSACRRLIVVTPSI